MPIQIKELAIKIYVDDNQQSNAAPDKKPGGNNENLVQMCIEAINKIQDRKKER
ncbi:MAG: DUF5908 family protein [Marinirhabdus sp.]